MTALRLHWQARTLEITTKSDRPLWRELLAYRLADDRCECSALTANLVSSRTTDGTHLPVLDLDLPHQYVPSSRPGHAHLYLDVELGRLRWLLLMTVLYWCGIIDKGFFWWSLRRGANFVRVPGLYKPGFDRLGREKVTFMDRKTREQLERELTELRARQDYAEADDARQLEAQIRDLERRLGGDDAVVSGD